MKNKKRRVVKIFIFLIVLFIILAGIIYFLVPNNLMIGKKTVHLGGVGGSMYPTLSWCKEDGGPENCGEIANTQNRRVVPELLVVGKDFKPERGMIVEVKHDGQAYGKRLIGLPGDTLLINNGFIYVDGQKLDEPYLWKPGMTYGLDFLQQCRETVVPNDKAVVLGDNRPLSHDSRDFGFVNIGEITAYLPLSMQGDIKQLWGTFPAPNVMTEQERDSFIVEVNKLRSENGLSPITKDAKLNGTAEKIAEDRVKLLDFSGEPSDVSRKRINELNQTGYHANSRTFRVVTVFGAYDLETYRYMIVSNERFRNNMLNPDFIAIGFGIYKGEVAGSNCSAGVSTIIMGIK